MDELDQPGRLPLLREITALIGDDDLQVPTAVWICAWLSPIGALENFVEGLRHVVVPRLIVDDERYTLLPAVWLARIKCLKNRSAGASRRGSRRGSLNSPFDSSSVPPSPVLPRNVEPRDNCQVRDAGRCVITRADLHLEVAHIYAYSLGKNKDDSRITAFWDLLRTFWSESQVAAWEDGALGAKGTPAAEKGTEQVHNMLCLAPTVHAYWGNARFALKPISLASDRRSLVVEFYWMPIRPCHRRTSLLARPELPVDLTSAGNLKLWNHVTETKICSGDQITFTTDDPELRPLPSLALLEMQWVLQRVAAMCGGAEEHDDDEDDNGDDGDAGALIDDWEASDEEDIVSGISAVEMSSENRPTPKAPGEADYLPDPLSPRDLNMSY